MQSEIHKLSFLNVLGSIVLVIASLYWARAVFVPLALALMLTFLLQPIVAALHRRGLGHMIAECWSLYCSDSGSAPSAGGDHAIFQLAAELPSYRDNLKHKIDDLQSVSKGACWRKSRRPSPNSPRNLNTTRHPPRCRRSPSPCTPQGSRSSRMCPPAWLSGGCWPGVGAAPVHPHGLRRLTGSLVPSHWLRALDGHHQSPRRSRAAHQPLIADAGDRQRHVRVRRGPRAVLLRAPVCPAVGLR